MIKYMMILMIVFTSSYSKKVTFDEALRLTVANNKELKAKAYETQKAKQTLKEAKAYDYGRLDFVYNISRTNHAGYVFGAKLASREATFGDFGFGHFIDEMGGLINPATAAQTKKDLLAHQPDRLNNPDARNNFESKLTYDVPIYTGGKLQSAKTMASLQISAMTSGLNYDKKSIGLEVLKAYNGAVTAKNFINMLQNSLKTTNRFIRISRNLFNNQLARQIDVKQSLMANRTIKTSLIDAESKFEVAITYLRFLTDDETINDVGELKFYGKKIASLQQLKTNAITYRDDYKAMRQNTQTMQEKVKFDSASSYPMVGAHVEYGMNDDTPTVDTDQDYYLGAVGLKYTIFDGQVSSINKQKAQIDYLKTKTYFEYMKSGIELEVKKNYLDFVANQSQMPAKTNIRNMAKDILNRTENVYKNNLDFRTNMMFVLMQFENLLKAKAAVIQTKYEQTILYGKLQISSGNSLGVIR
jgi:outer membrane protein TolC